MGFGGWTLAANAGAVGRATSALALCVGAGKGGRVGLAEWSSLHLHFYRTTLKSV